MKQMKGKGVAKSEFLHIKRCCQSKGEKIMVNKKFWMGMLVITLVFGMMVVGCKSYMDWYYSTLPGGKEQHDRQMQEINERNKSGGGGSSSGSSSPSRGSNPSGGSSTSSGSSPSGVNSSSVSQQPSSTGETITRIFTFSVPTGGQAGGGASSVAKAEAEANATERFRRENPGFEIRNVQSNSDGLGTLTVTITGRKSN